jgi:hypothetical protein
MTKMMKMKVQIRQGTKGLKMVYTWEGTLRRSINDEKHWDTISYHALDGVLDFNTRIQINDTVDDDSIKQLFVL